MAVENRGDAVFWRNPWFGQLYRVQHVFDPETNQEGDIYTEIGLEEAITLNGGVEPTPWVNPFEIPEESLIGNPEQTGQCVFVDPSSGIEYLSRSFVNPDTGLTWTVLVTN